MEGLGALVATIFPLGAEPPSEKKKNRHLHLGLEPPGQHTKILYRQNYLIFPAEKYEFRMTLINGSLLKIELICTEAAKSYKKHVI